MTARPLVSVCIPTYNGGVLLRAAVDSVLAQTWADFELIVIDDCSNDGSMDYLQDIRDARLRCIRNERNLGPEGNWNRCLAEARGSLFKLLPHDDLLAPECLAQQVSVLQADETQRIALVFSARQVIGPDGKVLTRRGLSGQLGGRKSAQALMRECLYRGTNVIGEPGAVLLRKSLADRIGAFDGRNAYLIDLDYWFRLLAHGDGYYCDSALASFRVWPSSWSVLIGAEQDVDFNNFMARMRPSFRPPPSAAERWLGCVRAKLNKYLRLAFYAVYLRRR